MEEKEKFMPFGKKVNEEIIKPKKTIVKNVTFPIDIFEEFDNYAKEMTGHCYWLAIKELLNDKKKNDELNSQLSTVLIVIENINERVRLLERNTDKDTKEIKHFGAREDEK